MKIKDYKCKCGHNDFFFADKGNQKGIYCSYCGKWLKWADKDEQNLDIKQEPCDDCIRRQAVIDALNKTSGIRGDALKALYDLPSVTPQPKMGRWIKHENPNLGQCMKISYECSNCKVWLGCEYFVRKSYCPNCGAKMQEVEQ